MGAAEILVDGMLIEGSMLDTAKYLDFLLPSHTLASNTIPGEPAYPQGDIPSHTLAENATMFPDGYAGSVLLPHLAFLSHYPPLRLFHLFPYALAQQYQCVPVGAERGALTVATSQRLELEVITHLQAATQCVIFQVYCEMSIIDDVLRYWQRMSPVTVGTDLSSPSSASL